MADIEERRLEIENTETMTEFENLRLFAPFVFVLDYDNNIVFHLEDVQTKSLRKSIYEMSAHS